MNWRYLTEKRRKFSDFLVHYFARVPPVSIEITHVTVNAIGAVTMRILFWLLSGLMLFVPSVLLLKFPTMYNPLTAFLVSFGLFALAAWASYLQTEDSAVKSANKRWLPQAESARAITS